MSANTVTVDPVTVITQLAENELTQAIVTAAKVSKKPRASKKTIVEVNEPSIVDEILINVASGKYAVESAANLTRIFGREFEPIAEEIIKMAADLPEDATVEVSVPVEVNTAKNTKKTKKVKTAEVVVEAPSSEVVVEAPAKKEKKSKKVKTAEVVVEAPSSEVVVEAPSSEVVVEAPAKKEKKSKKAKTDEVVAVTEVIAAPVKKPRAKKTNVVIDDDSSVAGVAEPKKTKNTRPPTPVLPDEDENLLTLVPPETSSFIDENADFKNHLEIEDPELAGFDAAWGEELVEEELSDIEEDE
jgi:hypothetical protein